MVQDPIIDEIRRIRHEIEAACENNAQKYYEHVQQIQDKYRHLLVRRQPPNPVYDKQKLAVW